MNTNSDQHYADDRAVLDKLGGGSVVRETQQQRSERMRAARAQRRVVCCRSCGDDTGIPGAAYCDDCRGRRTSDLLLTDVDRARLAEAAQPERTCDHVFVDSGPHPGCAEFAAPVETPCRVRAAAEHVVETYPGCFEIVALCAGHDEQHDADDDAWCCDCGDARADVDATRIWGDPICEACAIERAANAVDALVEHAERRVEGEA